MEGTSDDNVSTSNSRENTSGNNSSTSRNGPTSSSSTATKSSNSNTGSDFHFYPLDVRSTYHPPASFLSYKSKQIIRQAQEPRYATAPRISHFLYEV